MVKNLLKIFAVLLIIISSAFSLTGCGKNNNKGDDSLKIFEYMEKISPENSVEDINRIIGSDGKLTDEKNNVYTWNITDTQTLTARYGSNNTGKCEISADISDKFASLKDNKVDFSKYDEIKKALNSKDSITYDQIVEKIGAKGHLIKKSSSSLTYEWINKDGGYFMAYFNPRTNKCTMVSGRF